MKIALKWYLTNLKLKEAEKPLFSVTIYHDNVGGQWHRLCTPRNLGGDTS
jgi:hypothetical protein